MENAILQLDVEFYWKKIVFQTSEEAMAEENKEKKNKKVAKMTVTEVETALKKATDSGNTSSSKYVQHLEQRKLELSKS